MYQLILVIHIFAAACIIALVLVQQGKGAALGPAYGSGASQTVFGSRGSGSFLLKITISFVVIFFSTSIALNYIASRAIKQERQIVLPASPGTEIPVGNGITPSSIPNNTAPKNPETKHPQG
jgi:preprotein translocase subunit SecG